MRAGRVRDVRVASRLSAPVDQVWAAVKRADTFLYVTRGLIGAPALKKQLVRGEVGEMKPDLEGSGWVFLFHVLPLHRHTVKVLEVDEAARTIRTSEHGGVVRRWEHTLRARPAAGHATTYEDIVAIDAGRLTPLVLVFARWFYRYRHRRWRRLARELAEGTARSSGRSRP